MSNRKKKTLPEVNTSALPDIIFMLLFFFMVTTVMRKKAVRVKLELPQAEQILKLKHPSIHHHIYVGKHEEKLDDDKTVIQLNDKFVKLSQIGPGVSELVFSQPEIYQNQVNTCLQADKDLEMEILAKIKVELRKAKQLNLAYSAKK